MKALNRSWFIFLVFLIVITSIWADGRYTVSDPVQYRIRYLVEIKNSGGPARDLVLRMPIFMTEGLPAYQRVISFDAPQGVKIIKKSDEQSAEYRHAILGKGQSLRLEFEFVFTNYAIDYQLRPYRGHGIAEPRYLRSESGIESEATVIRDLAQKLTVKCGTQYEKARKLFEYVNANLEYQWVEQEAHSALNTLQIGKGVCEDFSMVYVALCRASGIPARLVRGYRFNPSDLKKGETDLKEYAHAWVEINLPAEGWVSVEPTFSYTFNGIKTVSYDFFGKIDKSDRHLFFSYFRDNSPNYTWSHDLRNPASLSFRFRTLLQKR